uniref:3-oxoacyl-[acyl-carrier-protein] reductase FabG n=1 Tax=Lygus hesperus TaxID=30085 RepID=A0A0A9WFM9_LYGHE
MNFTGKVVLITGASSGIGAATAIKFAKLGALLSLTGRKAENLKKVADECKKVSGNEHFTVVGSLEVEEDTKRILKATIDKYSKLDVLVNNAGIVELGSIEATSLEQYDRVFGVNVRAVYHLTMLATPYLVKSKGNIVNVSSVLGLRSSAGVLAYTMSKSTVDQFTKCVALELAPKKVRVNCVNPGVIITELQKRGGLDDAAYAKFLERAKETHALGRPGNPEEVADSILFLASDQATFITATHLSVDGGRHALCPR